MLTYELYWKAHLQWNRFRQNNRQVTYNNFGWNTAIFTNKQLFVFYCLWVDVVDRPSESVCARKFVLIGRGFEPPVVDYVETGF